MIVSPQKKCPYTHMNENITLQKYSLLLNSLLPTSTLSFHARIASETLDSVNLLCCSLNQTYDFIQTVCELQHHMILQGWLS